MAFTAGDILSPDVPLAVYIARACTFLEALGDKVIDTLCTEACNIQAALALGPAEKAPISNMYFTLGLVTKARAIALGLKVL